MDAFKMVVGTRDYSMKSIINDVRKERLVRRWIEQQKRDGVEDGEWHVPAQDERAIKNGEQRLRERRFLVGMQGISDDEELQLDAEMDAGIDNEGE
jgi:hypothetical protein